MKKLLAALLLLPTLIAAAQQKDPRWSEQKANDWYAQQPWLVGSNYIPTTPSISSKCGRPTPSTRSRSIRSSAGRRPSA